MHISKIKIRSLVIIAIITFLVVVISSNVLIKEMEKTQTKDTKQYLQEVGVQYKNSIVKQIKGDFQTLRAVATLISGEDLTLAEIIEKLKIENDNNPFLRMAYVTDDYRGYVIDINGLQYNNVDFSDESFIQQAMEGEDTVTGLFQDDLSDGLISCYAIPVRNNEQIVGVITATLEAHAFRDTINSEIFNNNGFAHIINSTGDIVIRSSHQSVNQNINNIIDESISQELKKEILVNLKNNKNGFYETEQNNITLWCAYVDIGINDWNILTIVPKQAVNSNFEQLSKVTIMTTIIVVGVASILIIIIINAIKKSQQSITSLAYYDNLTGLYNRNKFFKDIKDRLKKRQDYAFMFFDIDNFKFYNELFGYKEGNCLLIEVAKILRTNIQDGESCFRDNADKFGALVFYQDKAILEKRVEDIFIQIYNTQKEKKQRYNLVCNCGIKIIDSYDEKVDVDNFVDKALMALNKAKGMHTSQICFYDEDIHASATMKNNIENRMHQALEDEEFQVYLQPKINSNDESLNSVEALVRWQQADGTMIYPDQFIPLFEKNGFITEVDLYMLEQVCLNLRKWLDLGYPVKPVSVNQSRLLFYQEDYLEQIVAIIKRYHIDPSLIIFEITESLMVENNYEIEVVLKMLKECGFKLSLDDFGSGYSSLNTLKDLTIDELKIDKIFLRKTINVEKSDAILKCIFELAKDLSIKTVAEGVEVKEQCEVLKEMGCDVIQGYYYDRPLPVSQFVEKYLKNV